MRMSFNARLSWQTSLILSITMLVVFAYTWVRAQEVVGELSGRVVAQTSQQAVHRISALLGSAEQQASLLSGLASPSHSFSAQDFNSSSFRDLGAKMIEMLEVGPDIGSLTVVLDSTGESVTALRRTGGSIWLDIAEINEDGRWVKTTFSRYGSTLKPSDTVLGPPTDPRVEDGYVTAKLSHGLVWSNTRMVEREGETDVPAVSCSVPVINQRNEVVGVARADLTLANLSRYVQRIKFDNNGIAFLAELRESGEPRIIAHPDPSRLLVAEDGRFRLATIAELNDESVTLLVDFIRSRRGEDPSSSADISFEVHGQRMLAGYSVLGEVGRPDWILGIVVPSEVFMGDLRSDRNVLIVVAIVALMTGTYVSLLLAFRIAVPVQNIVNETERIRSMDFGQRQHESTNIIELDQLGDAMESLKTNLRSFEKLVPTQYARHLLATGQEARLGGERRHVTTYFADIVGFTRLSEMMSPEDLVEVLAEYLDVLSGKVIEHDGTVDKFNGDDVMAFWGAPNDVAEPAYKACLAALRSKEAIHAMHAEWRTIGMPTLLASFGISTGDVVVGNVGSRERMNYTVIGDSVNLASRLQGLNKHYETEILIGEQTRQEVGGSIVTRLVDFVAVAGREQPAPVYELIGLTDEVSPEDLRIAQLHDTAMAHYRERRFLEASDVFRTIIAMRDNDGPARILLRRCQRYLKQPPDDDWDGSYRAEGK